MLMNKVWTAILQAIIAGLGAFLGVFTGNM